MKPIQNGQISNIEDTEFKNLVNRIVILVS